MKFENIWSDAVQGITKAGPRLVATATFLPCGLAMGYTFAAFILERNNVDVVRYGPLFLGLLCAFICTAGILITKFMFDQILFWHFDILIAASFFNLLGGCFFFIHDFDLIGAFCVFIAHGLTFISSLSFLHINAKKESRSIYLSSCFVWYILGIASSVSVIASAFTTTPQNQSASNVYLNFAYIFMPCAVVIATLLVLIRVLQETGSIEYKTMLDAELRIANLNGKIFEGRKDVINRVRDTKSFFYVTKNKQWLVSFILIFSECIYSAMFTYFIFWFSLNQSVKLTNDPTFDLIMWTVLLGAIVGTIFLAFSSVKVIFIVSAMGQIVLSIIGMVLFATIGNLVPFWIVAFLFGVMFSCIKIAVLETSHFRFTEILIFISYSVMLLTIAIINFYFVSDLENLFFYSGDQSTLVAHGFTFLIVISMLSIIVGLQIPKTFKTSLSDIQYRVLGIIFTEHNIEQLNLGYLRAGKIPTVEVENT